MISFSKIKTNPSYLNVDCDEVKINKGDKVAIMGANGSGKTSLINAITGMIKSENDISKKITNSEIGYLMQKVSLPNDLFVNELLELVLVEPKKVDDENVEKLLNKKVKVLSGGELQYVMLYLITSLEKKIYFFDELTTGLDSSKRKYVLDNLINKKLETFCLVTHYVEEAIKVCNKILIMNEGNVVLYGEISELLEKKEMNYKIIRNGETMYFKTIEDAKKEELESDLISKCDLKDLLSVCGVDCE